MFEELESILKQDRSKEINTTNNSEKNCNIPDGKQLINRLKKALSSDQEDREGRWPIHVSSLIDFCDRRHFLLNENIANGKVYNKHINPSLDIIFKLGKELEEILVKGLIKEYGTHNFYGKWMCNCENLVTYGFGVRSAHTMCGICKTSVLSNYKQYTLYYKNLITGNPDLLMRTQDGLTPIEIKSKSKKEFEKVNQPDITHQMQAFSYQDLLKHDNDIIKSGIEINNKYFIVLYVLRDFIFSSDIFKIFFIDLETYPQNRIELYNNTLKTIEFLKKRKTLPEKTLCSTIDSPQAKSCPVRFECFAR